MATFQGGTPPARREVLTDTNPYGSRTLVVESDEASSVAYLCDPQGVVHGAVWLANHTPAPAAVDLARLNAGLPPVMPRPNTRHPAGRAPLDPARLEVLWFEEGDGVALFEDGTLLAVIPGWADMERGMPGYARDAIGETPFAWSLEEAMEGLAPRVAKARAYWDWRRSPGAWESYRRLVLAHLDAKVGPAGRYWDISGGRMPAIGVTERPAVPGRDYAVLSTVGMSCQRMPQVEQYIDRPDAHARVELAIATRGDARAGARLMLWLAGYPWHSVTWLGHGHTARWYHEAATFPVPGGYHGVLMLAELEHLPDLSGFAVGGDVVRWLWLVPVTDAELRSVGHGYEFLAQRVADRLPV
jgi:Suppressor of fused protein (SUFU).